ncbi:ribbon-helix-helix domain-containing protein [Haloarcula nitratireducens]|uniref:Ribbon-helix-helix domain-containing protein n=1 Tax=Haloarcula nitratireducens TaxID=2487749 RepID=A0AAW4PCK9_9EURY|nr:ribbon-helix-helix domain-containing protein [Halomicroarcula nitratireducens]MBX0295462.1 ribbon-helix-helix domain-containing protein [Halomicroarcula nitratireducens]
MSRIKVSLPDQVDSDIDRLVEQGEFINRDQAVEELLSRGISAYNTTTEDDTTDVDDDMFGQTTNEQQDPAMQDDDELGF